MRLVIMSFALFMALFVVCAKAQQRNTRIIGLGNILGGNGGSVLGGNAGDSINNGAGGPTYVNDEGVLSNVNVLNPSLLNGVALLNNKRIIGAGNILGGNGGSILGGNAGSSVNNGVGGASYVNDEGVLSNANVLNAAALNGVSVLNNGRKQRIIGLGNILGGNGGTVLGGNAGNSINSGVGGPTYVNDEGVLSNLGVLNVDAGNGLALLNKARREKIGSLRQRIIGLGNILGGNGGSVLGGSAGNSINNGAGGPTYVNDEGVLSNVGVLNIDALNDLAALNSHKRIIGLGNILGGNGGSVLGGNAGDSINNGAGGPTYVNDEGVLSNLNVLNVAAANDVALLNSFKK
ncbi:hypothetical protein AKO1_012108 [Acrasis kona]|uniref:Uncharacterized protein n=1 Tax=Acrasis kona TaxID=1008807 RepID=A0AAW2ZBS7_9EUKA